MKIYVYCEDKNEKTYLDVPEDECTVMIQTDYERRLREAEDGEEVMPRTMQEIFDEEINKPTFNNNQTETRRHCSMDTVLEEGFAFVGDENVTLEDEYASLYQAINELNEEQRELVDMIFFKGMKQKDVASIKGISAPAIVQRMAVIYSQLKKYLKKFYFQP